MLSSNQQFKSPGNPAFTFLTMKKLRVLLLLAVTAMVGAVVWDYFASQPAEEDVQAEQPKVIPSDVSSQATRWAWSQSAGDRRKVEVVADSFRQAKETFLFDLGEVELKIFHEDGARYDYVVTKAAQFDTRSETLFSEGEVRLSLGIPADHPDPWSSEHTKIRSSGVTFETRSGVATTEQYTEYELEGGVAHSIGVHYDSPHRYVRMESQVYVERFPGGPHRPALKIRSNALHYYEKAQRVHLVGEVSLERGSQRMRSTEAIVFMDRGDIRRIKASEAQGVEKQSRRTIGFRARQVDVFYSPLQTIERVTGSGDAEVSSSAETSRITASGERIELSYVTPTGRNESVLRDADIRDQAVVESVPAETGGPGTDVRRVRAAWIKLSMDEDRGDMQVLRTLAPGTLDLVPSDPARRRRTLQARRMTAHYAPGNRLRELNAEGDVQVKSHPPMKQQPAEEPGAILKTWSETLAAEFDPQSGEMRRLQQRSGFRFDQGGRRGRSGEAEFNWQTNEIELRREARVWESAGSVSADRILLDENTGDFQAFGGVSSTHQESRGDRLSGGARTGGPFSSEEPLYATADRMLSNQATGLLDYRGNARLWQGQNRVEADHIEIHRHSHTLSASGKAVSFLQPSGNQRDKPPRQGATDTPPVRVSADSIFYEEDGRRVVYRGGVELQRGRLRVRSDELEAFLEPDESAGDSGQSRLNRAVARGQVRIFEPSDSGAPGRRAFGVEADYDPATEKVVLRGNPARLTSESGRQTSGTELTYQVNDDRLLVLGSGESRSYSYRPRRQQ